MAAATSPAAVEQTADVTGEEAVTLARLMVHKSLSCRAETDIVARHLRLR